MLAMYRLYGSYLKGSVKAKIVYDSRIPDYSNMCELREPEWQGLYPGATEEVDKKKRNLNPEGQKWSYPPLLMLTTLEMKQREDQSKESSFS